MAQSKIDAQLKAAEKADLLFKDTNGLGRQSEHDLEFYSDGTVKMRKKYVFEESELSDFQ